MTFEVVVVPVHTNHKLLQQCLVSQTCFYANWVCRHGRYSFDVLLLQSRKLQPPIFDGVRASENDKDSVLSWIIPSVGKKKIWSNAEQGSESARQIETEHWPLSICQLVPLTGFFFSSGDGSGTEVTGAALRSSFC